MIEQDLLGISVNELIKNYCVLYDEKEKKSIGITTIMIAEKIDKVYGNDYEARYVFVDIFATNQDAIKNNKILSYYEVQKVLEEYIGWIPDPKDIDILASCLHAQWVEMSKDAATMLIQLMKIIKKFETLVDSDNRNNISNIQTQIDNWRKQWCHLSVISDESLLKEHIKDANEILKKMHNKEEEE